MLKREPKPQPDASKDSLHKALVTLREKLHHQASREVFGGRPGRGFADDDVKNIVYQSVAAEFLANVYANAQNEGKNGVQAIEAVAEKVKRWMESGGKASIRFSKTEQELFDQALTNDHNLQKLAPMHIIKKDSDPIHRRSALRALTATGGSLSALSVTSGVTASNQSKKDYAAATGSPGQAELRAVLEQKQQLLDDPNAWTPAKIKDTLAAWKVAQEREDHIIRDPRSLQTRILGAASFATGAGAVAAALFAFRTYDESRAAEDHENFERVKLHMEEVVKAVAEVVSNHVQVPPISFHL